MAQENRCANCAFWVQHVIPSLDEPKRMANLGTCHRYPPLPYQWDRKLAAYVAQDSYGDTCHTRAGYWCGEWKEKPNAEEISGT